MDINEAFPSKYIKSAEIGDNRIAVTIRSVTMQDVGDGDTKPVIYFNEAEKGLVCNRTNANTLADAYGSDTDQWVGKPTELFCIDVDYQGRLTKGIRLSVPAVLAKPVADFSNEALAPTGDDLPF